VTRDRKEHRMVYMKPSRVEKQSIQVIGRAERESVCGVCGVCVCRAHVTNETKSREHMESTAM
jgi:uncharacterized cysteine cluster protein YcgN (CxxCxxCC family)